MRVWLILALIVGLAGAVQAEDSDKGVSKEEYVKKQQKRAEKNGKNFNKEKAEASFDARDTDGNGYFSEEEKAAWKAKRAAEKGGE